MRILLIIVSAFLVSLAPVPQRVAPADLVFKNGNIYTANDKSPRAQAIAVKGDRIVFVGTNVAAQRYVGTCDARRRSSRQHRLAGIC